tara:strand:+ start:245 stop:451 length:207 start_codon:yes stop_codon:yes gene_type:complete
LFKINFSLREAGMRYTVSGTITTSVEMEIEAVSKEHAKQIFKRDWDDDLDDPYLTLDEETIDVDEEGV